MRSFDCPVPFLRTDFGENPIQILNNPELIVKTPYFGSDPAAIRSIKMPEYAGNPASPE